MKKIVYKRADGRTCIVTPLPKEDVALNHDPDRYEIYKKAFTPKDTFLNYDEWLALNPLSDDEYEEHVLERSIPLGATEVRYIDDEHIPATRELREAWVDLNGNGPLIVSAVKAKEIALQKVRESLKDLMKEFEVKSAVGDDVRELAATIDTLKVQGKSLNAIAPADHADDTALEAIKAVINRDV